MTTILFGNLGATSDNEFGPSDLSTAPNNGQSFMTGSATGSLSSLSLSLQNQGSGTTGTLSAYLYNYDTSTNGPSGSGTLIGTIANSSLSKTAFTTYTITPQSTLNLTPNTNYYIILTDSSGNIAWNYTKSTSGAGVAGTYDDTAGMLAPGFPYVMEVDEAVCFGAGTHVRTIRGAVAVDRLVVGDLVVTASGEQRPVRWLGHRTIDCRRHPRPREVHPVRIAAEAFGPGKPSRDLYVSPAHAICVDLLGEILIPAQALINGTTIRQVEVDEITYWHVELDNHDIILAENLPAESYIEMGNRSFFQENGVTTLDAVPEADAATRTHVDFCRPFHPDGPLVHAARLQLGRRALAAGWTLDASDPFAGLHLVVDDVRIEPVRRGLAARFAVPAGARDIWLVSATSRPCEVGDSDDGRDLGVCVGRLTIDDGFAPPRDIDLADPLVGVGFHHLEDDVRRWTAGRAQIPAELCADCPDGFFLRVELASAALPRWIEPASMPAAARPKLVCLSA